MTASDESSPYHKTIAVLGGGITGLSAAYRLSRLGHRVRLLEASDRLGGSIRTEVTGGWLIEGGPNSIQLNVPETMDLIRELGLDSELIEAAPAARNRYLVRRGRLIAAPLSPPAFLRSPLFSAGAKVRVFAEFLCRPRERRKDVSVADFVRRHFGRQLLDYAVQPLVSGIYAGDPARLSLRHAFPRLWELEREHGSILRGQIAAARARSATDGPRTSAIASFRRGLHTLPHALVLQLPSDTIRLGARVDGIERQAGGWRVSWAGAGGEQSELFDAVVCALPASGLARLRIGGREPLAGLADVPQPPVASLFLGYRREQVGHALDGFGVLVPAAERRSVLGVLFSSTLFAGRSPGGHVALTVLAGGSLQPEIARLTAEGLLARVQPDLRDLLGVEGDPVFLRHTYWEHAIPQYNLGYERHLQVMEACEREHVGIFIAGQVRDGIALPACSRSGLAAATRASGHQN